MTTIEPMPQSVEASVHGKVYKIEMVKYPDGNYRVALCELKALYWNMDPCLVTRNKTEADDAFKRWVKVLNKAKVAGRFDLKDFRGSTH